MRSLTAWFRAHARPLPWRTPVRDPYRALVSEAMLQQTQVARVVERYREFLRAFPTVEALAAADEQAVLARWQGLGYYRRARSLHAAARAIVERHGGAVPDDVRALRALPGVGPYTAGAIASMVFGRAEPLVDGNVQRVLARRFGLEEDPARGPGRRRTWATARRLVEQAEDPGAFNEGLMELGARVCTPRAPRCAECPIASGCAARAAGRQEEIPAATPRAERPTVHHHAVVIERAGRLLLQQRPATGLWGAMWQVPTVEAASALSEAEIVAALAPRVTGLTRRGEFVHQTTHRRVAFHVYGGRTRARRGVWRARGELDDLPMSNAQRRVLEVAG